MIHRGGAASAAFGDFHAHCVRKGACSFATTYHGPCRHCRSSRQARRQGKFQRSFFSAARRRHDNFRRGAQVFSRFDCDWRLRPFPSARMDFRRRDTSPHQPVGHPTTNGALVISSLIYRILPVDRGRGRGWQAGTGKSRSHSSCDVGLNRISFTSTSSGWLMAKSTQRAKLSAGIGYFL